MGCLGGLILVWTNDLACVGGWDVTNWRIREEWLFFLDEQPADFMSFYVLCKFFMSPETWCFRRFKSKVSYVSKLKVNWQLSFWRTDTNVRNKAEMWHVRDALMLEALVSFSSKEIRITICEVKRLIYSMLPFYFSMLLSRKYFWLPFVILSGLEAGKGMSKSRKGTF